MVLVGKRLDVNPGPASVIEMLGNGVKMRVACPKVDIEPFFSIIENSGQNSVFKVLRVRYQLIRTLESEPLYKTKSI